MGFDVGGNISNIGIAQFRAESRHAVLAIGHQIGDGFFMAIVLVGEISLEIVLLERALTFTTLPPPIWQAAQLDENTCSPWATSAAETMEGENNAIKAASARERK